MKKRASNRRDMMAGTKLSSAESKDAMTTEADFLQAIRDDPDDDAARLVFADWLEERGDPRSAFIRLQCELETMAEDDPGREERETRCQQLLSIHEAKWVGAVRGFV